MEKSSALPLALNISPLLISLRIVWDGSLLLHTARFQQRLSPLHSSSPTKQLWHLIMFRQIQFVLYKLLLGLGWLGCYHRRSCLTFFLNICKKCFMETCASCWMSPANICFIIDLQEQYIIKNDVLIISKLILLW